MRRLQRSCRPRCSCSPDYIPHIEPKVHIGPKGRYPASRNNTIIAVAASAPALLRTPLVDKQIPEQAQALGISEQDVIKKVMLKETVDREFTTVDDVAETALSLAAFRSNALTGQSIIVSHGWSME